MVDLLQYAQALAQHPLQYPLQPQMQPQIQAQLQKTLQPPSYEHLFQPLAQVFPVQQQLSNVHHMSLRQSSPQLLPELAKPYPYQFSHLPLFQPKSYPGKLERDSSGYPVMAGPNLVVYPSHQIKMLPIRNPHSIKAYGNYPRATFIPSKQSQILNSYAQQETATKLLNSLAEEKQHVCRHEGCTWAFFRPSDLKRHAKSHTKPMFHCPYWNVYRSCHRNGGSFSRLDVLKRHLRLVHYVRNKQLSNGDHGWCRACQKLFLSSKSFVDHCLECAASLAKGENDFDVKENERRA